MEGKRYNNEIRYIFRIKFQKQIFSDKRNCRSQNHISSASLKLKKPSLVKK